MEKVRARNWEIKQNKVGNIPDVLYTNTSTVAFDNPCVKNNMLYELAYSTEHNASWEAHCY